MSLVAKDVLKLPVFANAKVKVGEAYLDENVIEWVSVIEAPVENFVRKNEFVLTTGIGCKDDTQALTTFVKDVIQSGASVLAFATGRYIYNLPDSIFKLASEANLIILDIPWEVRFGDVVASIMGEITTDKQDQREEAEVVRQQLVNCVLNDKGIEDIVQVLYKYVQLSVCITNQHFVMRGRKFFSEEWIEPFQLGSEGEKVVHQGEQLVVAHPVYYLLEAYHIDNQIIYRLPIINNHKTQGYLFVQAAEPSQLSWFVMNVLEHTLTASALYFVKENAIELTEVRLKDNFVLQLAKQKQKLDSQLIAKADLLGYDLMRDYVCLVGDIYYHDSIKQYDNDRPDNSSLQSQNYAIQKEITYAGTLFGVKTMTTFEDGKVITFLEAPADHYMEIAKQFLDKVDRRLSALLKGIVMSWGMAATSQEETPFYSSYQKAKIALDIGIEREGNGKRTSYDDTKVERLLMTFSQQPDVYKVIGQTLKDLLAYDEKRQTDLVYTFEVYSQFKGNVSQTARALNLHRQSLMHRLRNIESLTNLSLDKSDDVFLLELSVRLWKLRQLNTEERNT
ncbi:purine catabolism regulatory protein [Pelagirhabdus alkalitolerans]|uniref:Purine catabolism regulatory protein n=1 Tax=Pelagirhabdus alkalitolerans TaxID=1612202 RepID=A0A1G6IZI8_9BACI|nr:PucR family transcriptional regulator [Pelagirhabdus alkalitolerans]SDC11733.1 purine catabolism regulatory protein [Pelagirhabdus alkalitolerans]